MNGAVVSRLGAHILKSSTFNMKERAIPSTLRALLQVPSNTENQYEQLILKNGIKVMLVSIPGSEKSAAALSLAAGAQDDSSLAGLAHFTEHAVFLGSEKFSQENHFKKVLNKNGGSSNGSTSMDQTTFQFEVNHNAFAAVLDVWSQFFVKPLMRDDAVEREIQAVTAEDTKNRILDNRRLLQVVKDLIIPESSYKKFSTGNVRTLAMGNASEYAPELAAILKRFHQLHYKPSKMALSLCGPQSISELEDLAHHYFEPIKDVEIVAPGAVSGVDGLQKYSNDAIPRLNSDFSSSTPTSYAGMQERWEGYPFRNEVLGSLVRIRPIKDVRDVTILYGMPPVRKLYLADPVRLMCFALNDKGAGSLFAALQDLGWASNIHASTRTDTLEFSIFEVHVSLTEDGYAHVEDVLRMVFAHQKFLFGSGDVDAQKALRLWEEMRTINALDFSFQEKSSAYALAPHLTYQMMKYPLHHVLSEGWLLDNLDLDLYKQFCTYLKPTRSVVILRNQKDHEWLGNDDPQCVTAERALATFGVDTEHFALFPSSPRTPSKQPNRVELHYGIPYHIGAAPKEILHCGAESIEATVTAPTDVRSSFPAPNEFICFDLKHAQDSLSNAVDATHILRSEPPKCVLSNADKVTVDMLVDAAGRVSKCAESVVSYDCEKVWYSTDMAFGQPRGEIRMYFGSFGAVDGHPINNLITSVYYQLVARHLYPAAVAGLSYSVSIGARGFTISASGYTPNLQKLLLKVIADFGSLSWWENALKQNEKVFDTCKDKQVRHFRSWTKDRPDEQAERFLDYLMSENELYLPEEKIAMAESASATALQTRLSQLVSHTSRMWTYYHGDRVQTAADTIEFHKKAAQLLANHAPSMSKASLQELQAEKGWGILDPPNRARLLSVGKHVVLALACPKDDEPNSALLVHFQTDSVSPRTSARMLLLRRLLHEPMFNTLRTKQQLGYIVSMSITEYGRRHGGQSMRGFNARILSNRFDPIEMQEKLSIFLEEHLSEIEALLPEELNHRIDALVKSLQDPPNTYQEESADFWSSILDARPFDWTERVIAELRAMTTEDVRSCYRQWFLGRPESSLELPLDKNNSEDVSSCTRRSIAVMLFGKDHHHKLYENTSNAAADPYLLPRPVFDGSASDLEIVTDRVVTLRSLKSLSSYRYTLPYHHDACDPTFGISRDTL